MPDKAPDTSQGYERSDAKLRPLVKWLIGTFVLIFGGMAVAWVVVVGYSRLDDLNREPPRIQNDRPLPLGLKLQASPKQDIDVVRAAETKVLTSYGWEDESRGIARIPIDRAIDLVVERGVPRFEADAADVRSPSTGGDTATNPGGAQR